MAQIKLKWKIGDAPTGRYHSFFDRGWPSATINDRPIAAIYCVKGWGYTHHLAKSGDHPPLTLSIADYSDPSPEKGAFVWRKVKGEFLTLDDAKKRAVFIIANRPDFLPK